ncbi:MAG: SH3 domain-containing protein [Oscillospiraceae bacterium]|jgi:hypothetical protein|nr:SH3 domain-containing protein [Oscillospiraceae bacterium]
MRKRLAGLVLAALVMVMVLSALAGAAVGQEAASPDGQNAEAAVPAANMGGTVNPMNPFLNPDPTARTLYARVRTTSGTLNLREKAENKAKVLAKLASDAVVRVVAVITETEAQWTQVVYKENNGYVMTKYLEFITELPYSPIVSGDKGEGVLAFKQAMRRLGYIKADDVNTKYDTAMETALSKLQLMNNLPLNPTFVSAETQALLDWGYIAKYRSGYLASATDETSGLSISVFVWDVSGTLYDYQEAVNVELGFGAQALGGQPPYSISVGKSMSASGAGRADPVDNPFYHMWTKTTDRLYIYATVTDAIGNTVTACAPYKYSLPPQYDGRYGLAPRLLTPS